MTEEAPIARTPKPPSAPPARRKPPAPANPKAAKPKAARPKAAKPPAAKPPIKRAAATPAKRAVAAGPAAKPPRVRRAKVAPPLLERLVAATVESLEADKAENVVVLDIASRSSFADRMVVATGLADRQIDAMATHLEKTLEEQGLKRIHIEASPDWVLLDAGDLIVHLFKPDARANYALERMWGPESPAGAEDA